MKWFGEKWGAPICESCENCPTPVGTPCIHCDEAIQEGDRGFIMPSITKWLGVETEYGQNQAIHLECMVRTTVGSVGHLRGTCSCAGGSEEDPPGLSRREAAVAAFKEFQEHFNGSH